LPGECLPDELHALVEDTVVGDAGGRCSRGEKARVCRGRLIES